MNISPCEHKSGQMLQALRQSLTWMPETFYALFPVSVNSLQWSLCPHLSSAVSKFKCLAAKHSCLNPLWTNFLVTCPRLDPNDGITARRCAWMSPEKTVVVFVQWHQLAISVESEPLSPANFDKPGPFCSSSATLARFFHVEIFWLVGESNTKFARHIPCCAWSAVKWITRQV